MIDHQTYVILSLETHLFNARQIKEHAIFIEATLTPKDRLLHLEASEYKMKLENLLAWAVRNANNIISKEILASQELVTDWTLDTEVSTQAFTGIAIDSTITKAEAALHSGLNPNIAPAMVEQIKFINTAAIKLLENFIHFQEEMRNEILSCRMFSLMYVTMLEHITDEAKWYRTKLIDLEHGVDITTQSPKEMEAFWTDIMRDHAWFIRGLLDPSQEAEIEMANDFANQFNALLTQLQASNSTNLVSLTNDIRLKTTELRDFKATATRAIDECKLRSIILPLVADHVLREANHFLRLLNQVS